MIKDELKNIKKHPSILWVVFAAIIISIIYSAIFIGSMWDPYGKLSSLPVAVVNEDEEVEYNKASINIGKDLVDSLMDDGSLKYEFVDEEVALKGLANGAYYMIITIPKDFSLNATTLLNEEPKKMDLKYAINPGTNYIASKLATSAANLIQANINEKVTELYAKNVFNNIDKVKTGMQTAADGSEDLYNGTVKLLDGTDTFVNGTDRLYKGIKNLKKGTSDLDTGAQSLALGASQVDSGVGELQDGSNKIVEGYTGDNGAVAGAKALAEGVHKLNKVVKNISISSIELSDEQKNQITSMVSNSEDISQAANQLSAGIGTGVKDSITSTLTSDVTKETVSSAALENENVQQAISVLVSTGYTSEQAESLFSGTVNSTLDSVAGNITAESITSTISPSVTSTITQAAGASALAGANGIVTQVKQSMDSFHTQLNELKNATDSLATGSAALSDGVNALYKGSIKLDKGVKTLKEGTKALNLGATDLSNGTNKLDSGAQKLLSGGKSLDTGAIDLQDGIEQINSGASTLSEGLAGGVNQLKDTIGNTNDKTYNMFAYPVELSKVELSAVANNGSSMTPYMFGISLWLAATIFCMGYPINQHFGNVKNGLTWWIGKFLIYIPVCILNSLLLIFGMRAIWGLHIEYLGRTVLFTCLVSLTFMTLYYMIIFAIGKAGSFLMILLLVVQLSASAGTYPIDISGKIYQIIHPFLPFTYVVDGFRKTLFTGLSIERDCAILGGITIVATLLIVLFMQIRLQKEHTVLSEDICESVINTDNG